MSRRVIALVALLLVSAVAPVGLAGVATAQDNGTATPTPTPTPNSTQTDNTTQSGAEEGGSGDDTVGVGGLEAASLYVEQPRFVSDPVTTSKSDGLTVYEVRGSVHEVSPNNVSRESVVRAGVREDTATLTYDKSIGRWILDTQGNEGTYRLYWIIRKNGTTSTQAAVIQVQQADYRHLSSGKYSDLQNQSAFGEFVRDEFEGAGLIAGSAGMEQAREVVEDAVMWYEFYTNPLQALSGQFTTFLTMLLLWPAGWIILATLLVAFFIARRKRTKALRKYKRQFARIEDVDEAERRAEERELKRFLSMQTFEDLGLASSDAEVIRQHCDAENPRQFLDRIREEFSMRRLVRTLLGAHDQLGHRLRVIRDADGSVVDADLLRDDHAATDGGTLDDERVAETISPAAAEDDVILALDWRSLDADVLWDDRVDANTLDLPVSNDEDATDLVDAMDVPIGEDEADYAILDRREEFAELLVTFIEHVAASEYTDEEGCIRPEADVLDLLYTFTAETSEKYRFPLTEVRDVFFRSRQILDTDQRMDTLAEDARNNDL